MKEFKEIGIRDKSLNDAEILKSLKELGKLHKEFKDQEGKCFWEIPFALS